MARAARDTRLETRTSRLKLAIGERYFLALSAGVSLRYRRTRSGYGVWALRCVDHEDKERLYTLGPADDHHEADGVRVLTFAQAQARCRELAHQMRTTSTPTAARPLTVVQAAEHYLAWYRVHRRAIDTTELTIKAHILPRFGRRRVCELRPQELRDWHQQLALGPARKRTRAEAAAPALRAPPLTPEAQRARKASANRVLTIFKALLNKAFQDDLVTNDLAWRKVKPFHNVNQPTTRFLTEADCIRLLNVCRPDLRRLVKAALFTGARHGELARLVVNDVNLDTAMVYISPQAKSGKPRYIPLSADGLDFFASTVVGKHGDQTVFETADGSPWNKNYHSRVLREACATAGIVPAIRFHDLRHTYASLLAQAGADLLTISKLLGHADTRITSLHYAHLCDTTLKNTVRTLLPSFGHRSDHKVIAIR